LGINLGNRSRLFELNRTLRGLTDLDARNKQNQALKVLEPVNSLELERSRSLHHNPCVRSSNLCTATNFTSNEREALYTSNMLTYHANEALDTLQSIDMNYEQIRLKITERLIQLIKESQTKRLNEGELDYQARRKLEHWEGQYRKYGPDDYEERDIVVSNANRLVSTMFKNLN